MIGIDLPTVWAGLISLALLAYVSLDGFDLGIGVLFPFGRDRSERDVMMNSVAPVWDGNETWLVLGGGGLFAAFPVAYSVLLTAFYAPVIAMLLALILRGVAFEFRFRSERAKSWWDIAFVGGSTLAAFCQGLMVGTFVQGVRVEHGAYAGGWFDWLTPFTVLCGVALVTGYALLGASWLVIKTEGELQTRLRRLQTPLGLVVLALIGLVSLLTFIENDPVRARWLDLPAHAWMWIIPFATAVLGTMFVLGVRARRELSPFLCAWGVFVLAFAGLAVSRFPYAIPPSVTYYEAANADTSLQFMLVGALVLLPIILGYTSYAYWVFRGKVRPGSGYH